jgi:hypothetical protein
MLAASGVASRSSVSTTRIARHNDLVDRTHGGNSLKFPFQAGEGAAGLTRRVSAEPCLVKRAGEGSA